MPLDIRPVASASYLRTLAARMGEPSIAAVQPMKRGEVKSKAIPDEIGPTEDGSHLRIRWSDGHTSEYAPRYLRLSCRCAGCVDEMSGKPLLRREQVPHNVYPLAIHYVGRYALRFDWSDLHRTGIYSFELLRRLCPCDECAAVSEGNE